MSRCYQDVCREQAMDDLLLRFKFLLGALAVAAIFALAVYGYVNA